LKTKKSGGLVNWAWTDLKIILVAIAIPLLFSCGGGSSPTSPSGTPPVDIAGVWAGTATTTSAQGTCVAATTSPYLPNSVPAKWTFQQTGGSVTGAQTLNNTITCDFKGTVSGTSVDLSPDIAGSPTSCSAEDTLCTSQGFEPVHMELQHISIQGTVSGNHMSLKGDSVWKVYDQGSGKYLGELDTKGTQDLTRQ